MSKSTKPPGIIVRPPSKSSPSMAQVATAIPAFIGYTEKQGINDDLGMIPKKIGSVLEFEILYGGASKGSLKVSLDSKNSVMNVVPSNNKYLYNSLKLFYNNGGGDCYIVSIGKLKDNVVKKNFTDGIDALKKIDEPTLYVTPDAALLSNVNEVKDVHVKMLDECEKLQDRFSILDVFQGEKNFTDPFGTNVIEAYRNSLPSNSNLKYGACYYPFLKTSLAMSFNFSDLIFDKNGSAIQLNTLIDKNKFSDGKKDVLSKIGKVSTDYTVTKTLVESNTPNHYDDVSGVNQKAELNAKIAFINGYFDIFFGLTLTETDLLASHNAIKNNDSYFNQVFKSYKDGITSIRGKLKGFDKIDQATNSVTSTAMLAAFNVDISGVSGSSNTISKVYSLSKDFFQKTYNELDKIVNAFFGEVGSSQKALEDLLKAESPLYSAILNGINQHGIILPPSGAVAGVYAKVDNMRGVWKAPANVGLNSVNAPAVKLSSKDQEKLNVDEVGGKSINVIRFFTGKGNLVWGARTLAGNDNEWRYVSVRRFFNMVQESVKKATEQYVFEPNDANTWVRVRSMIENFLTNQWRDGALAGAKTDDAFFVRVGLGQTMTAQDVLKGVMNIEIGMAVVRPAEFIILRLSYKLQK